MFSRRAASEFPNDNPELHDGLVWQSDSVTGHALPTLRLRQLTGTLPKVIGPAWAERPKRVGGPVVAPVNASTPPPVASVVRAAPEPAVAPEPGPSFVVASEQDPAPAAVASAPDAASLAPAPSAFDALVAALVRVALDRGATRIAA